LLCGGVQRSAVADVILDGLDYFISQNLPDNCYEVSVKLPPGATSQVINFGRDFTFNCDNCENLKIKSTSAPGSNIQASGNTITGHLDFTIIGNGTDPAHGLGLLEWSPLFVFCCDSGTPTLSMVPELSGGVIPVLGVILLGTSLRLRKNFLEKCSNGRPGTGRNFVPEGHFQSRSHSP